MGYFHRRMEDKCWIGTAFGIPLLSTSLVEMTSFAATGSWKIIVPSSLPLLFTFQTFFSYLYSSLFKPFFLTLYSSLSKPFFWCVVLGMKFPMKPWFLDVVVLANILANARVVGHSLLICVTLNLQLSCHSLLICVTLNLQLSPPDSC